jgi:hypothetical protein
VRGGRGAGEVGEGRRGKLRWEEREEEEEEEEEGGGGLSS